MTKIEWVARPGTTPESWSPITGCSKVSEGCRSCWAERMARRLAGRYGYPEVPHHFDVTLHPNRLFQPLHWRKPRSAFVCSMSDLFHESIEILDSTYVRDIFAVMALSHRHTFLLLTKRPHVAERTLTDEFANSAEWATRELKQMNGICDERWHSSEFEWPLPNVWLGTSVENQARADERIPLLLQTPAAVRFVSVEPMLEKINLWPHLDDIAYYDGVLGSKPALNWVLCGGESGPDARPLHPDWARDLRDQCLATSVPFFLKQRGAWTWWDLGSPTYQNKPEHIFDDGLVVRRVGKKAAGRLLDGREWNEFPA